MPIDKVINNEYTLGLAERISNSYNLALGVGAVLALAIIIYAGVRYSASGGNQSAIKDAKAWISAAIFGLVILFGSYLLLNTINPDLTKLEDIRIPGNRSVGISVESGDFQCSWTGLECIVNADAATCTNGFSVREQQCEEIGSEFLCNQSSFSCRASAGNTRERNR